jgi:AhpD family alkylhydroperoxidase
MKNTKEKFMDNFDKEKIENIIKTRKKAHAYYSKKSNVYKAFLDMENKTYSDGKLTIFQKELIAIGISVAINCESCMEWHIKQALDHGGTEEAILEAIEVGIEMAGGPATASARFAMDVLEYHVK